MKRPATVTEINQQIKTIREALEFGILPTEIMRWNSPIFTAEKIGEIIHNIKRTN